MIAYLPAAPADAPFICDGWIRSYRNSDTAGPIPFTRWREVMWPIVEEVQKRPGCKTLVACNDDDQSCLYGFICFESDETWRIRVERDQARIGNHYPFLGDESLQRHPPIVHYVYVKQAMRRAKTLGEPVGIARGLFNAAGIDPQQPFVFSFKTAVVAELARKIPLARWDDMAARVPREDLRR